MGKESTDVIKTCKMRIGAMKRIIRVMEEQGLGDEDFIDFRMFDEILLVEEKTFIRIRFRPNREEEYRRLDTYTVWLDSFGTPPELRKEDPNAKTESTGGGPIIIY